MSDLGEFELVIADWALPPDVIAFEHKRPDGERCLLASSTQPMNLADLTRLASYHRCNEEK